MFFVLFSCKNKELSYLGVSKVEVTCNLANELPRLELYLFSTKDFKKLELVSNPLISSSNGYRLDSKLLCGGNVVDGYIHVFDISFECKEFSLQKLEMKCSDDIYVVQFGLFQTLSLESSTMEISSAVEMYNDTKKGVISVQNNLYKPIYYLDHKVVSIHQKHVISISDFERHVIHGKMIKSFDIFSFTLKEKYHQVGGIVQTRFKASVDEYIVYSSYYYSSVSSLMELAEEGIDIASLEDIKYSR